MIIDSIRDYIKTCTHLSEFAKGINVNYLSEDSTSYSIEEVPTKQIIKQYIDGSSIRQYTFVFTSRESYGADVLQNIDNTSFYENFADWIEENNRNNILPKLDSGKKAHKIEVLTNGYAYQTDVDKAQYQIQLNLIYYQGVR